MRRPLTARLVVGPLMLAGLLLAGCSGGTDTPAESSSSSAPASEDSPAPEDSPTSEDSPTLPPEPSATTPEGVAVGEVVEGFPTDVVPVLPDSEITLSTVVPGNGVRQVSLAGTSLLPAEEVLVFYRNAFAGQGFTETAGVAPAGVVTGTFSRAAGAELLTVTVTTADGTQQFTVGGQLAG